MIKPDPIHTLGVIADTHIPDHMAHLHPGALQTFRRAGVDAILHAGDIMVPGVLTQLEQVAPVYAVRGNRDWLMLRRLPAARFMNFSGTSLVLTHGHGSLWRYLWNHLLIKLRGYRPEQFVQPLIQQFPEAKIIVFGHTHIPLNDWVSGRLIFNPGPAYSTASRKLTPSVGLLKIYAGGDVSGEILNLD